MFEDGTGSIPGHVWVNEGRIGEWAMNLKEGQWVRVFGSLKVMGQNNYIQVNQIRPLVNFDEFTHHFLSTISLHLNTTGRKPAIESNVQTFNNNFNSSNEKGLAPIQQAVIQVYSKSTADVGLHINSVIQALRGRYPESDVRSSVAWLMNEGFLYQTIDNDHAKSTN